MPSLPTLILDTDIDTDCDDAGALAVLHALVQKGECHLLGVVCSLPIAACAGAVSAINQWYARADIPIGLTLDPSYDHAPRWARYRAHRAQFSQAHWHQTLYGEVLARTVPTPPVEEAVSLYRRLLAAQPDASVTICAVGTLTALHALLASAPDVHSPLDGVSLVRAKVRELVSMAVAHWPEGADEFNWPMDSLATAEVLDRWPGPLTVVGHGQTVLTGQRFVARSARENPVSIAYRTFLRSEETQRPSWDLIAVLFSVRQLGGPFALSAPHALTFSAQTLQHRWTGYTGKSAPRRIATPLISDGRMAVLLEDLMLAAERR
jgi:inosine-uridine nucleoside N-ribohydrolase